jgi:hypothetical protein
MHTTSCYRRARPRSSLWNFDSQEFPNNISQQVLIYSDIIMNNGGKYRGMEPFAISGEMNACFEIGIRCQFSATQLRFRADCASAIAAAAPVGGCVHR